MINRIVEINETQITQYGYSSMKINTIFENTLVNLQ